MKTLAIVCTAVLCASATPAFAAGDHHMGMKPDMKALDTNSDGMISRDEFMKYHEMKWNNMKKNSSGMADMKDMEMMCDKMMDKSHDKMMDKSRDKMK